MSRRPPGRRLGELPPHAAAAPLGRGPAAAAAPPIAQHCARQPKPPKPAPLPPAAQTLPPIGASSPARIHPPHHPKRLRPPPAAQHRAPQATQAPPRPWPSIILSLPPRPTLPRRPTRRPRGRPHCAAAGRIRSVAARQPRRRPAWQHPGPPHGPQSLSSLRPSPRRHGRGTPCKRTSRTRRMVIRGRASASMPRPCAGRAMPSPQQSRRPFSRRRPRSTSASRSSASGASPT